MKPKDMDDREGLKIEPEIDLGHFLHEKSRKAPTDFDDDDDDAVDSDGHSDYDEGDAVLDDDYDHSDDEGDPYDD